MPKFITILLTASLIGSYFPVLSAQSDLPIHVAGEISATTPLTIQSSPNDTLYSSQWYLQRIHADEAWNTTRGNNLTIAIIDTGVDIQHPDLKGKYWVNTDEVPNNQKDDDGNGYIDDYYGYNFFEDSANVDDYHGHGTGIASIIAAQTNNGQGVSGINWRASIMVLKALNNLGGGDFDDVARAIRYAVDNGADIINMSFGSPDSSAILSNAVNYAVSRGVPMVAAVGNQSNTNIFYPAAYSNVIAVSGVDENDNFPSFSNSGSNIDLAAPATNIIMAGLVDGVGGPYVSGNGTSFAAAQVTGVASLVLGRFQSTTPSSLEALLKNNSDQLSQSAPLKFGSGVLNAAKVLTSSATQTSGVSIAQNNIPADGVTKATVTVSLSGATGSMSGREILVRSTHPNTVINNQSVVPMSDSVSVGITDYYGRVVFSVSSTEVGTGQLSFIDNSTKTPLQSTAEVVFTAPARPEYSMQWVAQSPYPTLKIGASSELWVEVRNTGTQAWVSDSSNSWASVSQVRLGTDRLLDRSSGFATDAWLSPNRPAVMTPEVVLPGGVARFTFPILARQSGTFREYFRPVVEYITWLNDLGIYWDITVNSAAGSNLGLSSSPSTNPNAYQATLFSQSGDVVMHPGDTATLSVTLTNVGTTVWYGQTSGDRRLGEVRLGTAQPQDHESPLHYLSWISSNRVANLGSLQISPGERVTIVFIVQAPPAVGTYQESFQLVSEYVGWFGPTFDWTITVI